MGTTTREEPSDLKDRVRALRIALGLTQEGLAGLGNLGREQVCKVESGDNKATSHAVRAGLARAFGLSRDDADAYLDGAITLNQAMRRRSGRTGTEG